MKNQSLLFALALASIATLSACSTSSGPGPAQNVSQSIQNASKDVMDWSHNRPSTMGKTIGDAPTGYDAKTTEAAPAPVESVSAPVEENPLPPPAPLGAPVNKSGLIWHQIGNYDAGNPSLPSADAPEVNAKEGAANVPSPIVKYGTSVDVYPVNADTQPYAEMAETSGLKSGLRLSSVTGEMIQQVFFPYGSAKISSIDSKNLRELAQSLLQNGSGYRLDVVGHASKRVNYVSDPIKRKMINFKMAQKRANAVVKVLVKAGAAPDLVVATSAGDEHPNKRRNGKTQEAADRRAEVFLNN